MDNKEEQEWVELNWQQKEEKSLNLIKSLFNEYEKPVVACSWGKDSLTVLHMVYRVAKELDREFDVLWNNTGVHYPSVYDIKRTLEDKWNLNIIEAKPDKTFWEIIEEYGYPGVKSSDRSDKANQSCCYHIKKKPTKQEIKKNEWDLYFDGLTAYESDRRYMNLKDYGVKHYHKTFGLQKCHPIGYWTVEDVWDYLEHYDIPYPDVYDQEVEGYTRRGYSEYKQGHRFDRAIRNGCWCCTLALSVQPEKMEQLRKNYPKHWQYLMESGLADAIAETKLGGQGKLDFDGTGSYLDDDTMQDWLDQRPCFFDEI